MTGALKVPDGSGLGIMTTSLPGDHWLTRDGTNIPPMPLRLGVGQTITFDGGIPVSREEIASAIRDAGRYAIRSATMNGALVDFDPDAMLRQFVIGMLGYHTPTGFSSDREANPIVTGTPK